MRPITERIDDLDLSVFDLVPSQTSDAEKRSLLAVQRAVARRFGAYNYLEIGSHLGGSLQPHVRDPRCAHIDSIDLRPQTAPDDRGKDFVKAFKDNSTERMLQNLRGMGEGSVEKIRTFDMDSKDVPRDQLARPLHLAFIDGEHTRTAVLRDHALCRSRLAEGGVILFHDLYIVFPALVAIVRDLGREGVTFLPVKLERSVFGLFFDPALVHADEFLARSYRENLPEYKRLLGRYRLKSLLPGFLKDALRA